MKPSEITTILKGSSAQICDPASEVDQLLTDSRHTGDLSRSLFFAIPTKRNTGCRYVFDLYQRGVRNFVVPATDVPDEFLQQFQLCTTANFWQVKDVVRALQQVAAYHRRQYDIPVVGITGSKRPSSRTGLSRWWANHAALSFLPVAIILR